MLRPERMSRVSVTGTKRVMADVIEAVHGLNLVHLVDYDGSWEGFDPGDPMAGADETSERLVTIRSIESILDLDDEDRETVAGAASLPEGEEFTTELEEIRAEVNELDDRRSELRDELRAVEERLDAAEPFLDLGLDLDLLSGYDTLEVRVGEGDEGAVRRAVADAEGIGAFDVFAGESAVAVFAAADGPEALDDALVGATFTAVSTPDAEGPPEDYVEDLKQERERLETQLDGVETDLEELKIEAGQFLLTAEEELSTQVQKAEAPLHFATTENAFVAEGWIPTDRYPDLVEALTDAVGDRVEVEELERADYDPPEHGGGHGHASETEAVATDGGTEVSMGRDAPPVIQNNPGFMKPFELLVRTIGRPAYWGFDPTIVVFLTFPVLFGFMIGDVGYGALYLAIGYWMWRSLDSEGLRALGGVGMWSGFFTIVFGFLYGEIFGFHFITTFLWEGLLGLHGAPMHKGLQPADINYAQAWLVVVMLIGLLHLSVGYVFGFIQVARDHGLGEAVLEKGSWLTLMLGAWLWILSRHLADAKPAFLFEVFNTGERAAFALGFAGLPAGVGLGGLGIAVLGFVLLLRGEGIQGALEFLDVVVNVLSYARVAAVLLAKAGMAFVVNLLMFGVYAEGDPAEYHFMLTHGPEYVLEHHENVEILFGGLVHGGIAAVLVGILILVLGHVIVLALGITSAGLQALRLQYYEFFSKFYYEGETGDPYRPFGPERRDTAGD